ncbi:uncharacterized protein V1510DRAFT_378144 [Dipodascopsis tothii]|uniref:uncharacterized protein n=1 Tax=Dipodascopsis tothii TaxID=44089 RepID=UPI0034CF39EE
MSRQRRTEEQSISSSSSDTVLLEDEGATLLGVAGNDTGLPLVVQYEKWSTIQKNLPNMLLENKGPVARDHMANERTYLAWVRTSLSFATIGLAVSQAFRSSPTMTTGIQLVGKLIGAGFIGMAISLMLIGAYRYYVTAIWMQRNKFPPSRAAVFNITVAGCVLIALAFIFITINTSR